MSMPFALNGNFNVFSNSSSAGVSEVAGYIASQLKDKTSDAISWQKRDVLKDEVDNILIECNAMGWDGYDAIPVKKLAVEEVEKFLSALPSWIPNPDVVPEPNGEIGLEWNNGENKVFVVSLDGNKKMIYAGIFGKYSKTHGTEIFEDAIPTVVTKSISRIF